MPNAGVPRATLVLSIAVGLLAGLVIGSFATGWYIVPTEVAIATVRTAADEIAEEMVRSIAQRLRSFADT